MHLGVESSFPLCTVSACRLRFTQEKISSGQDCCGRMIIENTMALGGVTVWMGRLLQEAEKSTFWSPPVCSLIHSTISSLEFTMWQTPFYKMEKQVHKTQSPSSGIKGYSLSNAHNVLTPRHSPTSSHYFN